jgi:hypothetical protein
VPHALAAMLCVPVPQVAQIRQLMMHSPAVMQQEDMRESSCRPRTTNRRRGACLRLRCLCKSQHPAASSTRPPGAGQVGWVVAQQRSERFPPPPHCAAEAAGGGFWSYVAGVAYYIQLEHEVGGLRIDNHTTTLPARRGLSSSAAVCVLVRACTRRGLRGAVAHLHHTESCARAGRKWLLDNESAWLLCIAPRAGVGAVAS